jgi:hypothetical protein
MRHVTRLVAALVCAALYAPAIARADGRPAGRADGAATTRTVGALVMGSAWNAANRPLPNARVRLRNVRTGRIEMGARANERGQFTFEPLEGGTYVIELVDERGRVLAVGQVFTLSPGEALATFVRLASPATPMAAFFGNAAAAVVSAAGGLGITALGTTGHAQSPER